MGRVEGMVGNRDVLNGGKGGGRAVLIVHGEWSGVEEGI